MPYRVLDLPLFSSGGAFFCHRLLFQALTRFDVCYIISSLFPAVVNSISISSFFVADTANEMSQSWGSFSPITTNNSENSENEKEKKEKKVPKQPKGTIAYEVSISTCTPFQDDIIILALNYM